MARLTQRKRIREALACIHVGQLVIWYRDSLGLNTPASPALGSICRVKKIDKTQKDLQVLIRQVDQPTREDWVSVLDLEPCPPHWKAENFA